MPDIYDYQVDNIASYPRGNLDNTTNEYGDRLLALCKAVPLRICNGRKIGDILGEFTCYTWNGKSMVDYCMVSPRLYHQIQYFQVENLYPALSDHCPIAVKLRTKFITYSNAALNYEFLDKPKKVRWDKQIAHKFEHLLQLPESKNFLTNFAKNEILGSQTGVDSATAFLTDFITNTAINAGMLGNQIEFNCPPKSPLPNWKFKRKKRRPKIMPKWHDATCESLSKDIKKTAYLLKKYPNNPFLRGLIQSESKKYKKLVKSKHKAYINNLFKELDTLHGENPRGYMYLVKSLRDGSFDSKKWTILPLLY